MTGVIALSSGAIAAFYARVNDNTFRRLDASENGMSDEGVEGGGKHALRLAAGDKSYLELVL